MPKSQTPTGGHCPAAAKEIVPLHDLAHVPAREEININPVRGNENLHTVGIRVGLPIRGRSSVALLLRLGTVRKLGRAAINFQLARGIYQHAVSPARHKKRHGRVGSAVVLPVVNVHAQIANRSALVHLLEIQPQPVYLLAPCERETQICLSVFVYYFDVFHFYRKPRVGQPLQTFRIRRCRRSVKRSDFFRHPVFRLPNPLMDLPYAMRFPAKSECDNYQRRNRKRGKNRVFFCSVFHMYNCCYIERRLLYKKSTCVNFQNTRI